MRAPTVRLGEIASLQAGIGFPPALQGRKTGDFPFAKVGDISRCGRSDSSVLSTADHYVDQADVARLRAKLIPAGSILFAKIGEAIRQNHRVVAGCDMLIDNNAMAAIPTNRVDGRFLYNYLKTVDFYALAPATTVPALRKSELETLRVPLPPLEVQRRIAAILDQAETLRTQRRAALAQLDSLTQSLFLDMFGDPVANPKQWDVVPFGTNIATSLRNGLSPSSDGIMTAKVLTLSAITGGGFNADAWKLGAFHAAPPVQQSVNVNDFLVCRGNGNVRLVGKGYFPDQSFSDVTFPDTIIAARINVQLIAREYLQFIWNSSAVRRQVEALARTTNGTFKVNQTMLESIQIVMPPLALQQTFATRIQAIEALKATHRAALAELDALFASLQQRAFAGEL